MKRDTRDELLVFVKRNIRLAIVIIALISLIFILVGTLLPQDSMPWRIFLKIILIEIGTTILIASTIGVFLTEAYTELREATVQNEIFNLVDRIRELVNNPQQFKTFQLLSNIEQAGLLALYPNRKGSAQEDLRSRITQLLAIEKQTTIYVIGDTLRVFFGSEGPFSYTIHQVLSENRNVSFKVLLLHPNCELALFRSESETLGTPFKTDDQFRQSGLFHDSSSTSSHIHEWNRTLPPLRGGSIPFEVKYYYCADYCLAAIFPDVCYTAQYIYADAEAQVQTPGLPMLKYKAGSVAYNRLLWNFNWIWQNHAVTYEEVAVSLQAKPIVQFWLKQQESGQRTLRQQK